MQSVYHLHLHNKLLLIEGDEGEIKLPGGGIEGNESDHEALIREVMEETGYTLIESSIRPYGEIM